MNLPGAEYGDAIADRYDEWYDKTLDSEATADYLNELRPEGRVLELGVGTGRVALRLAEAGRDVTGIDLSAPMLEKLRMKDPGGAVKVVQGDMRNLHGLGRFSLVYAVFNTLFGLRSAEDQAAVFAAVATVLDSDGLFVVEAHIPSAAGLANPSEVSIVDIGKDTATLELMTVDQINQRIDTQLIEMRPNGNAFYPARLRYAYPSEMQFMARSAGLEIRAGLTDWAGTRASADAHPRITVYESRPPPESSDYVRPQ